LAGGGLRKPRRRPHLVAPCHLLPAGAGKIALDVGAGSGRDAGWLAARGLEVVAAEPTAAMRREGARLHPAARWLDDRLPDLAAVHRLGLAFDLILLSAVWMHIAPPHRPRAFRKLVTLLKPGGRLIMTLLCLRLPDDGSASLPLIRGVILNDAKSSTYKLALLRAVARIADSAPAAATPAPGEEDRVSLPLGLVALNWIRGYLPLTAAGLP
jgi:SAM-dependent methyltransferase